MLLAIYSKAYLASLDRRTAMAMISTGVPSIMVRRTNTASLIIILGPTHPSSVQNPTQTSPTYKSAITLTLLSTTARKLRYHLFQVGVLGLDFSFALLFNLHYYISYGRRLPRLFDTNYDIRKQKYRGTIGLIQLDGGRSNGFGWCMFTWRLGRKMKRSAMIGGNRSPRVVRIEGLVNQHESSTNQKRSWSAVLCPMDAYTPAHGYKMGISGEVVRG